MSLVLALSLLGALVALYAFCTLLIEAVNNSEIEED